MKRTNILGLAAVSSLSLGLVACGGGLDIDQVRHDLDNPSGSVSNQQAVMAVDAKRTGSGPALDLTIGGVPGQGLTAEGKGALSRLSVRNWESRARLAHKIALAGDAKLATQAQGLVADTCTNGPEAQQAYNDLFTDLLADAIFDSSPNGSASFTVDLAECSDGALTGSMKIELEIKLEEGRSEFTVKESFDNACDTTDARACVNGEVLLSAVASDMSGTEAAEIIYAWDLSATWTEDGVERSASVGGGMRLLAESTGSSALASFEVLFYVDTPEGQRYGYVWRWVAESSDMGGTVTWSLRGADGEITCTADETMVSCTGDASITFTSDDVSDLDPEWLGG